MNPRTPDSERGPATSGRGFASMDPERQREVVGYVRSNPVDTMPAQRFGRPAGGRMDWMRVLPERDGFEGSSSRRGR